MDFYYDQKRDILVYPLSAQAPLAALSDARQINGQYFAVPRNLSNSQVLARWNYSVPPVMDDYDWPHKPGITPYESQKITANFLVLHPRCFCLSDMGTGKTLSALWAADWLMRRSPGFRALIVCPLSIMERVWSDAISQNFLSHRSFEVLHGTHQKRKATLEKSKADFLIINYEGVGLGAHTRGRFQLDGFSKALSEKADIGLTIIDEASAYRDARTKRHRISRLVCGQRPYLWLLTGTPTPNAPVDAYGLAKIVNNAYGKSFTTFQNESMFRVSQFRWVPQQDGYDKARRLLSPAIRYAISDVWDGPELTTQQRQAELTAEQKKLIAELKKDLIIQVKSGEVITAAHEAAARMKFLQISAGVVYDHNHKPHPIDATPRIDEVKAVIEEAPGKLLIFSPLTSVLEMYYKLLTKWERELVNGSVSAAKRSAIFSDFQSKASPRILLVDPGCAAHGLDLWQARTVLWLGPIDKAEQYAQANKRAHRPGQHWPVAIVQIVSNNLEREIFRRLENNLSLQGALLDAVAREDF